MKYSKKEITRAGNTILVSKSQEEINSALLKINDWRTSHLQPLKVMKRSLMKILAKKNIEPYLVSQRLKRLTSIVYKLDLNPNMGLGGMQDIGGYRAVVKDTKDLKKAKRALESVSSNHKLEKINDYIENPKISGYRSIHYIYKYYSKTEKYNSLKVELQLRTKLQHYWATAVETAGIITKTSLKSSQGPDEWLEFFKIVSSLFAIKENLPVLEIHKKNTMQELMVECYNYCEKLKVIDTLKALRVTTEHLEKQKFPGDYYLIHIDIEKQIVSLNVFNKSRYNIATRTYLNLEKEIDDTKNAVVLVSATSFKSLKQAYPSYFLDTSEFLNALERINANCINRGYLKTINK
ncbi:RelA/SpoT domain-containing protein [Flavobacterium zhairuonense]|uniref:RelA/SpoT domain-containing protein n=1 Tax=Flavobacterium zhairuonense TaxID=2493631 RepID=UPI00105286A7|nr:RelA/SpoT domain-containing protein [Flavobacterium zhairuonense]KAF2508624.1 RelA/SpoT domain-containing protein [Flavobacterium zhairuonense]